MKFLICPIKEEQSLEPLEDNYFKACSSDSYYQYEIELDEDTVRISDSIGRSVPVDISEIGAMAAMLNRIDNYVKNKEKVNEYLLQTLLSGASL